MIFLTKAAGLILSLSLLVILHEMGHFLFARLFKVRVEKFYLFFNPWFSIFKFKKGDTEYGIGWLPLGGYVKIAGMIDESLDTEQLKQEAQPWEFRAKPAWQRFLIMIGGVLVNFIVAMIIYIAILYSNGHEYLPIRNCTSGVTWDSLALENGLRNGDRIYKIGDKSIEDYADITSTIVSDNPTNITVERDGVILKVPLAKNFVQQMIARKAVPIAFPAIPFIIDTVLPQKPAFLAGLQKNDRIISINGRTTPFDSDARHLIQSNKKSVVEIKIIREDSLIIKEMTVGEDGLIGVGPKLYFEILKTKKNEFTFLSSIPAGIKYGTETLNDYVKQLKWIFTSEGAKSVGGFGAIGNIFPQQWDWLLFWERTAFLSIILAFMNILPIPALDGGHAVFIIYEMITRRKPSDKVIEYAQIIGMVLLFSLLIFANGNDLVKLFTN